MNVRDQIVSYLAGELGPDESAALRARLRQDEAARAEYDALAELVYGAAEREPALALQARVLDGVEAALDAEGAGVAATSASARSPASQRGQSPTTHDGDKRRGLWRWFAALTLAAATAAVLALVLWPHADGDRALGGVGSGAPARVQYRGGSGSGKTDPRLHLVALEMFAISPLPRGADATQQGGKRFGPPRLLADGDTVELGDYLQLRYRNDDPGLRYVYVFGLDARRQRLSYFPRPKQREAQQAQTGVHGLGRSLRLSHRHERGKLHVIALLSPRPLDHDAVAKLFAPLFGGDRDASIGDSLSRLELGAIRLVHRKLNVR